MSNYTGLEPQDHSYLQIQGRATGMFPGDWKAMWNSGDSADVTGAMARLGEYRDGKRRSPIHYRDDCVEYRLVRITVHQTVTEEALDDAMA